VQQCCARSSPCTERSEVTILKPRLPEYPSPILCVPLSKIQRGFWRGAGGEVHVKHLKIHPKIYCFSSFVL
jgi:hypothetical protein